jgi:hypothetical protein
MAIHKTPPQAQIAAQPNSQPKDETWFSCKTTAERWECSEITVRRRLRARLIPYSKNGRLTRIPLSGILEYERQSEVA